MNFKNLCILVWVFQCLIQETVPSSPDRSEHCTLPAIRLDNNGVLVSHNRFTMYLYPDNLDCDWIIKAPPGNQIMVQFDFLSLEEEPKCNFDYVEFENLMEGNVKVCGNIDIKRYVSQQNQLIIRFHSDKATGLEGFMLRYWFIKVGSNSYPLTKSGRICSPAEFECRIENSCIPKQWVCDRVKDCIDNSDENDCGLKKTCHRSQLMCEDGECLLKEQFCNTFTNCNDRSDENNCKDSTDPSATTAPVIPDLTFDVHKCSFQPIKPQNVNITEDNAQIVGGEEAVQGSWPWMASLQYSSSHYCGATLISRTWAVTAAHCFENGAQPEIWQLDLGRHYMDDNRHVQRIPIKSVIIHELYNSGTIENDIALLHLSKPATLTARVQTLCLPDNTDNPPARKRCVILGWGVTKGKGIRGVLNQAVLPIVDQKKCASYYKGLYDTMVCAGYEKGGVDSCQQDSGGPLICSDKGHLVLSGIISWGEGCALPNRPGVYTSVAKYITWIKEHVKDMYSY